MTYYNIHLHGCHGKIGTRILHLPGTPLSSEIGNYSAFQFYSKYRTEQDQIRNSGLILDSTKQIVHVPNVNMEFTIILTSMRLIAKRRYMKIIILYETCQLTICREECYKSSYTRLVKLTCKFRFRNRHPHTIYCGEISYYSIIQC